MGQRGSGSLTLLSVFTSPDCTDGHFNIIVFYGLPNAHSNIMTYESLASAYRSVLFPSDFKTYWTFASVNRTSYGLCFFFKYHFSLIVIVKCYVINSSFGDVLGSSNRNKPPSSCQLCFQWQFGFLNRPPTCQRYLQRHLETWGSRIYISMMQQLHTFSQKNKCTTNKHKPQRLSHFAELQSDSIGAHSKHRRDFTSRPNSCSLPP